MRFGSLSSTILLRACFLFRHAKLAFERDQIHFDAPAKARLSLRPPLMYNYPPVAISSWTFSFTLDNKDFLL